MRTKSRPNKVINKGNKSARQSSTKIPKGKSGSKMKNSVQKRMSCNLVKAMKHSSHLNQFLKPFSIVLKRCDELTINNKENNKFSNQESKGTATQEVKKEDSNIKGSKVILPKIKQKNKKPCSRLLGVLAKIVKHRKAQLALANSNRNQQTLKFKSLIPKNWTMLKRKSSRKTKRMNIDLHDDSRREHAENKIANLGSEDKPPPYHFEHLIHNYSVPVDQTFYQELTEKHFNSSTSFEDKTEPVTSVRESDKRRDESPLSKICGTCGKGFNICSFLKGNPSTEVHDKSGSLRISQVLKPDYFDSIPLCPTATVDVSQQCYKYSHCSKCPMMYLRLENLQSHQRVHTFPCNVSSICKFCFQVFHSKWCAVRHMQKLHAEEEDLTSSVSAFQKHWDVSRTGSANETYRLDPIEKLGQNESNSYIDQLSIAPKRLHQIIVNVPNIANSSSESRLHVSSYISYLVRFDHDNNTDIILLPPSIDNTEDDWQSYINTSYHSKYPLGEHSYAKMPPISPDTDISSEYALVNGIQDYNPQSTENALVFSDPILDYIDIYTYNCIPDISHVEEVVHKICEDDYCISLSPDIVKYITQNVNEEEIEMSVKDKSMLQQHVPKNSTVTSLTDSSVAKSLTDSSVAKSLTDNSVAKSLTDSFIITRLSDIANDVLFLSEEYHLKNLQANTSVQESGMSQQTITENCNIVSKLKCLDSQFSKEPDSKLSTEVDIKNSQQEDNGGSQCLVPNCKDNFERLKAQLAGVPVVMLHHIDKKQNQIYNFQGKEQVNNRNQTDFSDQEIMYFTSKDTCSLTCDKCGSIFYNEQSLNLHRKLCSKDFVCRLCQRPFTNKDELLLHVRSHLRWRCELCSLIFRTNKQYQVHIYQKHQQTLTCDTNQNSTTVGLSQSPPFEGQKRFRLPHKSNNMICREKYTPKNKSRCAPKLNVDDQCLSLASNLKPCIRKANETAAKRYVSGKALSAIKSGISKIKPEMKLVKKRSKESLRCNLSKRTSKLRKSNFNYTTFEMGDRSSKASQMKVISSPTNQHMSIKIEREHTTDNFQTPQNNATKASTQSSNKTSDENTCLKSVGNSASALEKSANSFYGSVKRTLVDDNTLQEIGHACLRADGRYHCDLCNCSCETLVLFQEHRSNHMVVGNLKCPSCPAEFHIRSKYRTHLKLHSCGNAILCAKCFWVFSAVENLISHFMVRHTKPRYWRLRKHLCVFSFQTQIYNNQEMILHACKNCNLSYLQRHKSVKCCK